MSKKDRNDNRAEIFRKLAALGATRVTIDYDGESDSGCIGSSAVTGENKATIILPEESIEMLVTSSDYDPKTKRYTSTTRIASMPFNDAIEQWCYDILEAHFCGWQDNDGAYARSSSPLPMAAVC